jgi:metal-sulfur cluster biosynthetic enzyme
MDAQMISRIDAVLDSVTEPESGLTIAQIGLVRKVRFVPESQKLYVIRNPIRSPKGCCIVTAGLLWEATAQRLKTAFAEAFPQLTIEIV